MLIDGRKAASEIYETLSSRVKRLSFIPIFADVVVGDDPASLQYVAMKGKAAERIGIHFIKKAMPRESTIEQVTTAFKELSATPNICGIISQLPLPKHLTIQEVLSAIPEYLDVDAVGDAASAHFYAGENTLIPPTAASIMHLLATTHIPLQGQKVVIIGKGLLVGKPVAYLLRKLGVEPKIIDRSTPNPDDLMLEADVIISAAGKPKFVTGEKIKEGAVVIDAGTAESDGQIKGDVDIPSVEGKAAFLSPVPGGVGPVTVAKLLENVVRVAERLNRPLG